MGLAESQSVLAERRSHSVCALLAALSSAQQENVTAAQTVDTSVSERCVDVTSPTVMVRTRAQASVSLPAVSDHVDTAAPAPAARAPAARAPAARAPAARAPAARAPQAADYTVRSSALILWTACAVCGCGAHSTSRLVLENSS